MNNRRVLLSAVAILGLITRALIPAASAQASPIWSPTGHTVGCPSSMHVLVPSKSPDYFADHPADVFSAGRAGPSASFAQARARVAAAHIHYLTTVNCRARTRPSPVRPTGLSNASTTSTNWSGYVSKAKGDFLGAVMLWTVPSVSTAANSHAYSSIWPGIGSGNSASDSLIQDGTEQDVNCLLGVCSHDYYPWVEIYPYVSQLEITNLAVAPNQSIEAFVEYDPSDEAYFEIDNLTTGQGVYEYEYVNSGFTGSGSTAEWIVERTEVGGQLPALADFGTESIAAASAEEGKNWDDPKLSNPDVSSLSSVAYTMKSCSGTTLAAPSAVTDGSSFTVAFKSRGTSENPTC